MTANNRGDQTRRMHRFMKEYIDADKGEEHRVAIQLMRHTLMHTGALRYPYDETQKIAYTWQVYFGDSSASKREHYTLTVEDPAHQGHLLEAADGRSIDAIKALNFRLIFFAETVLRAANAWDDTMHADKELQGRCVSNYADVRFQLFNRIPRPKSQKAPAERSAVCVAQLPQKAGDPETLM